MQTKNDGDFKTKVEVHSDPAQLEDPVTALIREDERQKEIQEIGDFVRWMRADDELIFYGTSREGAVKIAQSREVIALDPDRRYVQFSKRLSALAGDGSNQVILCFLWSGMVEKVAGPEDRIDSEKLFHFSKNESGKYQEEGYCCSRIFANISEGLTLVGFLFGTSIEEPRSLRSRIAQFKLVSAVSARPTVRVQLLN
jgi:hypothetical protein